MEVALAGDRCKGIHPTTVPGKADSGDGCREGVIIGKISGMTDLGDWGVRLMGRNLGALMIYMVLAGLLGKSSALAHTSLLPQVAGIENPVIEKAPTARPNSLAEMSQDTATIVVQNPLLAQVAQADSGALPGLIARLRIIGERPKEITSSKGAALTDRESAQIRGNPLFSQAFDKNPDATLGVLRQVNALLAN